MGKLINLTGQKFGKLTVIERAEHIKGQKPRWRCVCCCDDKTEVIVYGYKLRRGSKKSCGCYAKEKAREIKTIHGLTNTRLFSIFTHMKQRCYNPKHTAYKDYGGRGIAICSQWLDKEKGFINFYNWAMNNGYEEHLTIDRIDNNQGYSPQNCRWATMQEQNNNTRANHLLTYKKETHTIAQWAEIIGIKEVTLKARINKYGWTIEKALTTVPKNKRLLEYKGQVKSMTEWAKELNLPVQTISNRINQYDWDIERALSTPVEKGNKGVKNEN